MELLSSDIYKIIYKYIYDCVLSEVMEVRLVFSKQDRFLMGMRSCFYLLKKRNGIFEIEYPKYNKPYLNNFYKTLFKHNSK